jgi:addiction module HigA family antidote
MPKTWKSLTITGDEDVSKPIETTGKMPLVHPGEILREDFLNPLGISAITAAKACSVPRTRIERLLREETSVTADTALRLGRYLGTSAQFWLNLQAEYDLRLAEKAARSTLTKIKPVPRAAAE